MDLIGKIKLINNGMFDNYVLDAYMVDKKVIKDNLDVGLSDRKENYFYTRLEDSAIKLRKPKVKMTSCINFEIEEPKVAVFQWRGWKYGGIMYAILNEFASTQDVELISIETRKEMILKEEDEIKPFDRHLFKIKYKEIKRIDNCENIECEC